MSKGILTPLFRVMLLTMMWITMASWAVAADSADGANTYKTKCMACHGADGAGTAAGRSLNVADLRSPDVQKLTSAQLQDIVKNGKNNMPAFADSLSDQQIADVVAHVRTFGGKPTAPAGK
jgi:mono/diheme cytochrome c family protein